MKTFVTIVLCFIAMQASALYPIDPRPLRKLIAESEYIVIGHVIGIEKLKKADDAFDANTVARIRIHEVLKGTIRDAVVDVSYHPNYICPAPPHFEPNTDVVIFLNKRKGTWRVHALSYGVKTLSAAGVAAYRSRIIEMKEILTIQDSYAQFFETVEWLVKCVEHPETRWEGTYELSPQSDFMSYYARSEFKPFQSMLSADQRERLKTALFNTAEAGYANLGLIDLVYRGNEKEVHAFVVELLKRLPDHGLFMASEYMERVLRLKSTAEMEQLVQEFSTKRFETRDQGELRTIVRAFVALAEER